MPCRRSHFAPKAKRVIYLFMSGAPSHLDLFDPKPVLTKRTGKDLPDSVRKGQRITGMTSGQKQLLWSARLARFASTARRAWRSRELLPHTGGDRRRVASIRSMFTEPINHDPAVTFFRTGNQQPGRPTMGSWLSYGLGSRTRTCRPMSSLSAAAAASRCSSRYWGSGFLPAAIQGVPFRSTGDPVLYVSNPPGIDPPTRRAADRRPTS